jgi:hypothetical protein
MRYAVDIWKPDVIVLTFGWQEAFPNGKNAIRNAYLNDVLVVAPAGTATDRVVWPARESTVIAINATDGYGNSRPTNPPPRPSSLNFAVLGQSVYDNRLKSGTGIASITAGAIAAFIIDIVRRTKDEYIARLNEDSGYSLTEPPEVANVSAMASVFRQMSKKRDGYDVIFPWLLIDGRPPLSITTQLFDRIRKDS